MPPSTTLTDLPVEILELIGAHVGKDLQSLRLVSRYIDTAVSKIYKKAFFSHVTVFLATESSLRKAVAIIQDPSVGPAVRRLILVDDSLPDGADEFEDTQEGREDVFEFQHPAAICRAQRELWAVLTDLALLTELLRLWSRTATFSTIKVMHLVDGFHGPPHYLGWYYAGCNHHCFITVMQAVIISGAKFSTFTMDTDDLGGRSEKSLTEAVLDQYAAESQDRKLITAALNRFENLDLTIEADRHLKANGFGIGG
jgi:hypothetical protein